MTQEKKSERMEVRLGYSEKQAFVEACDVQGDTPSGAVRRFISGYTRRADGDVMGEANRRLWRRYGWTGAGIATLAVLGVGSAVLWIAADHAPSRFMSAAAFAAVDGNGDGTLDENELGPQSEHLLRVLDLRHPPGIQLGEAVARGRMSYAVGGPADISPADMSKGDAAVDVAWTGPAPATRLVEFDLNQPQSASVFTMNNRTGTFKPDRSVIWEEGRARPKLVFGNADVALGPDL